METPYSADLSPETQDQIENAFKENGYITIVGKETNTNSAVGLVVDIAKANGKKVVQIDIPKPKISFINNFDDKKALDLFAAAFSDAGLQLADVDDVYPSVSNSLKESIKGGINPTLVVVKNIQNLPKDYGEDLIISIRGMYNMRATEKNASNLQFVLVGEKDPDEIRDPKSPRTPYNIGVRVKV